MGISKNKNSVAMLRCSSKGTARRALTKHMRRAKISFTPCLA